MTLRVICQKFCATRSGPTYSNFCSGKSAEVTTALTPGSAAAFEVSIERMRAWAWGERRMWPTSMPGITRSDPYNARPVTFGTPSGRTGRVPTHLNGLALAFVGESCMAASPGRRIAPVGPDRRAARAQMQATASDMARAFVARHACCIPPMRTGPRCCFRSAGTWGSVTLGSFGRAAPMLAYTAPTTVEEAVRALAEASGVAKVLSGGTDLLVQLRSGRAKPNLIVDIKKIPNISGIRERDGAFAIGAEPPAPRSASAKRCGGPGPAWLRLPT